MKFFKRLAPIVLVLILVLAMMPTGAFATTPTPVTISVCDVSMVDSNGAVLSSGYSFAAYKIMSWTATTTPVGSAVSAATGYAYSAPSFTNTTYRSKIVSALGLTGTPTDNQILTALKPVANNSETAWKMAYGLKSVAAAPTQTTTSGVFVNLPVGYYLILQTAGTGKVISKPILVSVPTVGTVSLTGGFTLMCTDGCYMKIMVKTTDATIEKKIVIDGALYDSSTAAVGDVINYQSKSTMPSYTPVDANSDIVYKISDSFSTGLTFNSTSLVAKIMQSDGTTPVKTLVLNTDYTLTSTANSFLVSLSNPADIKTWGNAGDIVLLTYNATVNPSAVVGNTGNPNSVNLTFGEGGNVYTTPDDTVISYITKLVITKTDNNSTTPLKLAGAVFTLSKKAAATDVYTDIETQTTGADGTATFTKLSQGTYKLTETTAPTGYKLLADPIIFTVTATNTMSSTAYTIPSASIVQSNIGNTLTAQNFKATWATSGTAISATTAGIFSATIVNEADIHLPGTGGIGTTIFTVAGALILLLAAVMFVVYNKKHRKGENH